MAEKLSGHFGRGIGFPKSVDSTASLTTNSYNPDIKKDRTNNMGGNWDLFLVIRLNSFGQVANVENADFKFAVLFLP